LPRTLRSLPFSNVTLNLSLPSGYIERIRAANRANLPQPRPDAEDRDEPFFTQGLPNDKIAAALSIGRDVVSQWRKRFFHDRLPGLEERERPGRPRAFPPRGHRTDQGDRV